MTSTLPDLAALREKAEELASIDVCEWVFGDNETELMVDMTPEFRDKCVQAFNAVLALVDEQAETIDTLRGAVNAALMSESEWWETAAQALSVPRPRRRRPSE